MIIHETKHGKFLVVDEETGEIVSRHETRERAELRIELMGEALVE